MNLGLTRLLLSGTLLSGTVLSGALLSGALLSAALGATAQAAEPPLQIPFEKTELDNGLDLILSEDHSVPFVWVEVWYSVGSKDEKAGRTGFAHLYEHLMFQGSAHLNDDYFVPLQAIGARINGTTNTDRTNSCEGVPSEHLPLALWLESDRMGYLLPALDGAKLQNQKDVVRNERRQSYENRPYGKVWMWLAEALYPEGHPYHTVTIGKHEDIEAATLEDVKDFFRTWYVPNNATLAIVGDFDPAQAKALVQQYFGSIPKGPQPTPVMEAPASLDAEKVIRKEDDVPLAKVWISWLTPKSLAPGDADLDIVANLLSDGKDSRLYVELVKNKQIAKEIAAYQSSSFLGSEFVVEATAAEGHTTDEVVAAIDQQLSLLRAQGPTQGEVDVARTQYRVGAYGSLQTIQGKANRLCNYNVLKGDPGYLGQDLARYDQITIATAQEAARQWLPQDKRVVLHVTPRAKTGGK
jgi:predicted Zn-dependent peptidase